MEATPEKTILSRIEAQRAFFATGTTRSAGFRKEMLRRLRDAITANEKKITDALRLDLHKSHQEDYLTEISLVLAEIRYHMKHVRRWTRINRVRTPIYLLPSCSRLMYQPLGVMPSSSPHGTTPSSC